MLNYVEGSEGSRVQPLAHASFDAWIKSYRPNENSSNTTMTYYSRGQLIASVLDAMIIDKYQGKKCLDHFMQTLYQKFYKNENRGFTEVEFVQTLSEFMGSDMKDFIDKYVNDECELEDISFEEDVNKMKKLHDKGFQDCATYFDLMFYLYENEKLK